jgi:hypothetical protein
MTPPDYKETAAKLTGHEDCPHWMDDDHYCRKCEAIGPVLKALAQADALGYARAMEELRGQSYEAEHIEGGTFLGPEEEMACGGHLSGEDFKSMLLIPARALTAEPAKEAK